MKKSRDAWISAEEAASALGVHRATLYAYVSRGHIRSEPMPGVARQRRYSRDDLERLQSRTAERRDPGKAAAQTLQWGLPVLDSAITLISDGRIWYRGHDAAELAGTASVAEVASLIWTGNLDGSIAGSPRAPIDFRLHAEVAPFITQAQMALAEAASRDPAGCDLRAHAVARTGWRILNLLARVAADSDSDSRSRSRSRSGSGSDADDHSASDREAVPIDQRLAAAWAVPAAAPAIRAALILCADHELNVSAFTARCVASAGTHPYAVVVAALAALEGPRHGGATSRIESLWDAVRNARDPAQALADRLRRGERPDGFGHPLYAHGDPRARLLLDGLPASEESEFAARFTAAAYEVLHELPALDFGLVAMRRVWNLPEGAALALFAIGRTIGWIGHAIEQYALDTLIRPRARYVGEVPERT